ncbi:MAG: prepilin-type N-terminal cleavage/methylation domain-containing protein [Phycisphaerae bacterium]|jgi:prepilin-type N-terminal cleavage/methylation domain-containing protein/prepilin-type processing-associated H-X9-DG protein|nr:prepilin-type N-terminal cleavage/methylation domain-containing protein [Phycisphaerae bacterium]
MKTRNFGFTLVELLVVIALIALLAMLLVPSFQGAAGQARAVQCRNNLKRIGEAVEGRKASLGAAKLEPYGWPTVLVEYLGQEGALVLECPEADGIPETGGVHKPLEEFACIVYPPNYISGKVIEFVESGIMAKASQRQWEASGENLKVHWSSGGGYEDDGSGVIYWGYEDQGAGGDDYQDVLVKETLTPDGRSKLECKSETSGKPCIWDKKNETVLIDYTEFNYHYGDPPKTWKTAIEYVETGSGSGSNYAMNAHTIGEEMVDKIMAMDYIWVLARSTDDWDGNEQFDADNDGEYDFARHNGRLNVLFPGGRVDSMAPYEIDPSNLENQTGHWLP